MADTVDRATRSRMMSAIKGKNTLPERTVRSYLHRSGLRFRLHTTDLPGCPDIVLPRWGCVVFIHGCFWHRHPGCRFATTPASNTRFWKTKFDANVKRDRRNTAALRRLGWRVIVVWECSIRPTTLRSVVRRIRRE